MRNNFFRNKTILITGGTGSFGKALLKKLIDSNLGLKKIIIFSRDELKQFELQKLYSLEKYPFLRFFLGDIRDSNRLNYAFKEVDYVIHAAALKQVPAAEYNPFEFIQTNVLGVQNIIESSLTNNVKKVIALSTDKAVSPLNLYGATKLCGEKLFISANNYSGSRKISFSVVRYGNVFGSRGSVFHEFIRQKENRLFEITDKNMTRFNIEMNDAVEMVIWVLRNSVGNEIFIPKLSSIKIIDLAKAIDHNCKIIFKGIRAGEKLHEELVSNSESLNIFDIEKYYIILNNNSVRNHYFKKFKAKRINSNFSYNSETNKNFLDIKEIKKIIDNYKNLDL
jgi:UDP-N-acetylglucosamine 4,6-dehydratase (inverting)